MDFTAPATAPKPIPADVAATLDKKRQLESVNAEIAKRQGNINTQSPAAISQMMGLYAQRDALGKALAPQVTAESAQDVQKAGPYERIGKGGQFKGPEFDQGPATEAETAATKPYERIGNAQFFKGPGEKPGEENIASTPDTSAPQVDNKMPEKAEIAKGEMPQATPEPPVAEKKAEAVTEKGFGGVDWKTVGRNLLELINAGAAGQAGITNPEMLATGQRVKREQAAAQLAAEQKATSDRLAAEQQAAQLDRNFKMNQAALDRQFNIDQDATKYKAASAQLAAEHQNRMAEIAQEHAYTTGSAGAAGKPPAWLQAAVANMKANQNKPAAKAEAPKGAH